MGFSTISSPTEAAIPDCSSENMHQLKQRTCILHRSRGETEFLIKTGPHRKTTPADQNKLFDKRSEYRGLGIYDVEGSVPVLF